MTIAKATAPVTLGNLNQTYTGTPLSATATTTPSGLTVNLTYNGSSTAPTAAGSYTVVGTISDVFTLGPFSIMPIRVTHSLVDCVALAIHTPVGLVVHTGDFKIDLSSPDAKPFDLHAFAELGKQGVLCLLQDSTNVDRPGYTPSERAVRPRLDEIFSQAKKKLFFSCFSSSIHRIRIAMELAAAHGRKVAVVGRSLDNSTEIAQDLGYLDLPPGLIINPGQIRETPDNKILVLISGTQGEPMSALSRAAVNNHKYAHIDAGDTVVLSSRVIPGNEKSIYRMIDHLERRDAKVIYDDGTARPHPRQRTWLAGRDAPDDQPAAAQVLHPHPRRLPPPQAPRRARRQPRHRREGHPARRRRDPRRSTRRSAAKTGKITVGRVCIDAGGSIDVVEDVVIRDRQHISEGGIVLPIITINKRTGKVENFPEIVMRGFAVDDPAMISEVAPGRAAHPRNLQRRGEGRLRRHQGKNPQRPQALHPEEHQPPPPHHARHPRNLSASHPRPFPPRSVRAPIPSHLQRLI